MSIKRTFVGLVAMAAASLGLVAVSADSAAAADLHFVAGPKKVVVNQAYENINWSLTGADVGLVDSVDAYLEHVSTRETADLDFTSNGVTRGVFKFYDFQRLGRYVVYGVGHDTDFNELTATPTYLTIKLDARSSLTAKRAGRYVTLKAVTKKYNGGYPLWTAHRGATVTYQRYGHGAWRRIARRTVPRNGITQVRLRSATSSSYRVVATETSNVWGDVSATVRR